MGVSTAHAIAPHLLKLGYDNNKDLVPVAFVGAVPNVLVVNNDLGVNSVAEPIALAKKQPGKLNYASSGSGSTQHIAAELFKEATGSFITHIPYRGSGPALIDLMAGQVQMSFDTMASVLPHIKSGKVRAIAVASDKRSPQLPQVPTAGRREDAIAEYTRWLPLINCENRQGGILTAKVLMKEGGVIACEAPRHPFPAMNPAVRAGLLETARRLDPLVLRWGTWPALPARAPATDRRPALLLRSRAAECRGHRSRTRACGIRATDRRVR